MDDVNTRVGTPEVPEAVSTNYDEFLKSLERYNPEWDLVTTHDGYPLSAKEAKFISAYISKGDVKKALEFAGCNEKYVLGKDYILDEIRWRLKQLEYKSVADTSEILEYFTAVMRGEIKDQFGFDAPLSERTRAAQELAKRTIDVQQRAAEKVQAPITLRIVRD